MFATLKRFALLFFPPSCFDCCLNSLKLLWTGLDLTGLDWTGLDWTGDSWTRLIKRGLIKHD